MKENTTLYIHYAVCIVMYFSIILLFVCAEAIR